MRDKLGVENQLLGQKGKIFEYGEKRLVGET